MVQSLSLLNTASVEPHFQYWGNTLLCLSSTLPKQPLLRQPQSVLTCGPQCGHPEHSTEIGSILASSMLVLQPSDKVQSFLAVWPFLPNHSWSSDFVKVAEERDLCKYYFKINIISISCILGDVKNGFHVASKQLPCGVFS